MKKSNLCNSLLQLNRKGTKQLPLIAFLLLLFCSLIMATIFSSCSNEGI